jgi:hypothetical protein
VKNPVLESRITIRYPFSDCLSGIFDGLCRVAVHAVLNDDDTKAGAKIPEIVKWFARTYKSIIILNGIPFLRGGENSQLVFL